MKDYNITLLTSEHSTAFFQLIDTNRSRLEDFFAGTLKHTSSLEDTIEYCKQIEEKTQAKTYFPYLIIEKNTKKTVGLIDVKNIDWSIPKAELGAFIDHNFEGLGIITKSAEYVMDLIVKTHKFKKLYCRVAERNTRSLNVVLRCGFELEGTIRCDYRTSKGELVDLNYYGKLF